MQQDAAGRRPCASSTSSSSCDVRCAMCDVRSLCRRVVVPRVLGRGLGSPLNAMQCKLLHWRVGPLGLCERNRAACGECRSRALTLAPINISQQFRGPPRVRVRGAAKKSPTTGVEV
jgi:hypothetical protein